MRRNHTYSPIQYHRYFKVNLNKSSSFWVSIGRRKALDLFHRASELVPAYKDFLIKEGVNHKKIKTWVDFQNIPKIDKKNYLKKYSLEDLHWKNAGQRSLVFTSTSGSTGDPVYFTRSEKLEFQYASILNDFLSNSSFRSDSGTLVIVCFAMGVWIGGLITYRAYNIVGNYLNKPISIITPGINKPEILKTIRNLGPKYHQTILVGYPPFIKDIIDEAISEKIPIKKLNLRFHFAAEAISETFREYLMRKSGVKNPFRDFINIYGSADIGAMAYEGPASILIKRLAMRDKSLFSGLFSSIEKTPTLAQYNPLHIQFEAVDGKILLTGDNSIPLIRYSIGDHGGVFDFDEQKKILLENNVSFIREARVQMIDKIVTQHPFVFVYERSDFSTTLYGINIYPEMIRDCFLGQWASRHATGRFQMVTQFDTNQNQILVVNIEMNKKRKATANINKYFRDIVIRQLCKKSSEFRELHSELKNSELISIKLWPNGHERYFSPNVKQTWVDKSQKKA